MRRPLFVLTLVLSPFACDFGNDEPDAQNDKASADPNPPVKPIKKDLASLVTGDKVSVPEVYKSLELGMTGEQAKAVFPDMPGETTIRTPEYDDVYFNVDFGDDTGRITRFYFSLPKSKAKDMVTKKWGAPTTTTEYGKEKLLWFNPEAGLRASLKQGFGDDMDLELTAYIPYDQFLGNNGLPFAFESSQPLLGATAEQLRTAYPTQIVETSHEDAKRDRKAIENMVGDKVAALGPPRPSIHLQFPPTEYEAYWTRVNMMWNDDGTVRRYWFMIGFEPNPAAKERIFEFLGAKLGEFTEEDAIGGTRFVSTHGGKRVEVKENTIAKGWDIAVEPPAPAKK